MAQKLTDLKTWTGRTRHGTLRSFTDDEGNFWLEQNAIKKAKWAQLAREGHDVAWVFAGRGDSYTGRMLIDNEVYTPPEAKKDSCSQGSSPERANTLTGRQPPSICTT